MYSKYKHRIVRRHTVWIEASVR